MVVLKNLVFNTSKTYFIYFTTSLYNTPNIKGSIYFNPSFKYSFFIIIFNSLSLSLSLSEVRTTTHNPPPAQLATTTHGHKLTLPKKKNFISSTPKNHCKSNYKKIKKKNPTTTPTTTYPPQQPPQTATKLLQPITHYHKQTPTTIHHKHS